MMYFLAISPRLEDSIKNSQILVPHEFDLRTDIRDFLQIYWYLLLDYSFEPTNVHIATGQFTW